MDNIILLDLDGVLIVDAPWRVGELHIDDGWDVFKPRAVKRLNEIIDETGYDIVLSSARRRNVHIWMMNGYFRTRGVTKLIKEYVPDYSREDGVTYTRRQEIERFLEEHKPKNYLIIDDDKSLSDASDEIKSNWIQTELMVGLK